MTVGSYSDQLDERMKYFSGYCSKGVIDWLRHDPFLSWKERMTIIPKAMEIANEDGRNTIYKKDVEKARRIIKIGTNH